MGTYVLKVGNRVSYILVGPPDKNIEILWNEFKTRPEISIYNFADLFARHLIVNFGFNILHQPKFLQLEFS